MHGVNDVTVYVWRLALSTNAMAYMLTLVSLAGRSKQVANVAAERERNVPDLAFATHLTQCGGKVDQGTPTHPELSGTHLT